MTGAPRVFISELSTPSLQQFMNSSSSTDSCVVSAPGTPLRYAAPLFPVLGRWFPLSFVLTQGPRTLVVFSMCSAFLLLVQMGGDF